MTPKERLAMQQALEALTAELEAGTCEEFENAAEKCYEAITALQEALEQPVSQELALTDEKGRPVSFWGGKLTQPVSQEPVAWLWVSKHGSERLEWEPVEDASKWKSVPLYTAPQPVSQDFEIWWQEEGQEFLYALNTTTDDDIKLVAEFAWNNGTYKAEQPVNQEPVANVALKDCIYFDSIDFSQAPPYLRYDTGDSTAKENWNVYCDIQEDLRQCGYELTDSGVDHDTVFGNVTPIATPQPVKEVELTDDEIMQTYTNFNLNELGEQSFMLGFARAVIAAYKEKNK